MGFLSSQPATSTLSSQLCDPCSADGIHVPQRTVGAFFGALADPAVGDYVVRRAPGEHGFFHGIQQRKAKGLSQQVALPIFSDISAAVELLATTGGLEARGAIFTRREVVDFLLDLTSYSVDKELYRLRLLEPSFGGGDFLMPAIERLLTTWDRSANKGNPVTALANCVRAVELHRDTFASTKTRVMNLIRDHGFNKGHATQLVDTWLLNEDFLLADLNGLFDVVIGNPPYVRQELIPAVLLTEYRSRYSTLYDRADLYIPFIERSLTLLGEQGALGFICADRWMKNRYGGPLRKMIARRFHLKVYVDMVNTPAFHTEVDAYPAITVITHGPGEETRVARRPEVEENALRILSQQLLANEGSADTSTFTTLRGIASEAEPWILDSSSSVAILRRLEATFPSLEHAGCKVGIGVATGADKAFIGPFDELDVEADRKLRLVMTKDIRDGTVRWQGLGVINPFQDYGGLVDLEKYPALRRYLEDRQDVIAGRHCAQKSPANWYRTIDRITPALATTPKLLIPDIKGEAHIVYEHGELYPHHNLYHVTSTSWDLRALQAVLLSSVTQLFVATYCTKMRGGFLRFQAQYLRRVRIPAWEDVSQQLRENLASAAAERDFDAINRATYELYGLNREEEATLERYNDKHQSRSQ